MNLHEQFIADHGALRKHAVLLQSLMTENPASLGDELRRFQTAVQTHFGKEEPYYRALDDGKRVSDRGLVHQLRNDHAAVIFAIESLCIRLRKGGATAEWGGRFDRLMEVFLPHLDVEEKTLFPLGQKFLSAEEISRLTAEIQPPL
jgi:hypothetical protein